MKPWPVPKLRGVPWISRDFRNYEITAMGWEVQPDGLYEALERFHAYGKVPKLTVTENGSAYPDALVDGRVHDDRRTAFYEAHLAEVKRAVGRRDPGRRLLLLVADGQLRVGRGLRPPLRPRPRRLRHPAAHHQGHRLLVPAAPRRRLHRPHLMRWADRRG